MVGFGFQEFVVLHQHIQKDAEGEDDEQGDNIAEEEFAGEVAVEDFCAPAER